MIENVLEIAAPAEKVFDFVVDVLNEPRWNPQMLHADQISRSCSWAAISRLRALDAECAGEINDITGGCRLIMRPELRPHGILHVLDGF
jgi:hypothetical protein